jgi:CO/xanthine dehydrogenase FAD-binding subunit
MSLGQFRFHQPSTLAEACALGHDFGHKSAYLAGGTELLVDLRSGRKTVCHVISLGKLDDLKLITVEDDVLRIGALVSLSEIAESKAVKSIFPALSDAIETMAGRQIRNLGTMGGNFCCGVPCSDTPPISCVADAEVVLTGPEGSRVVPAREFVIAPRVTVRKPGEILTEIRIPRQPSGSGASFQRFALRKGSALAVASVSAWVLMEGNAIKEARIYLGSVGPTPLAAEGAASLLVGGCPGEELFACAGEKAATEAQPISDLRGSEQYRRDVVKVLTSRALKQACERAEGQC